MSYCTLQDLTNRYGLKELIDLSDNDNTGAINTEVIDRAISDAEGEIDGYLASRYPLPINPVPKSIARIACDIARYYLYDDVAIEQVNKRYNDAVKFLKAVSQGDVSIGITATGDKPSSKNNVYMHTGGNTFNRKDKSFI